MGLRDLFTEVEHHNHDGINSKKLYSKDLETERYVVWRVAPSGSAVGVTTSVGGDLEFPLTASMINIGAYVDTAGTTGTMTIDVNKNGVSIFAVNKITIESGEKSSRNALTPPNIGTTAIVEGDIFTTDIDAVHTTAAKGLTIRFKIK